MKKSGILTLMMDFMQTQSATNDSAKAVLDKKIISNHLIPRHRFRYLRLNKNQVSQEQFSLPSTQTTGNVRHSCLIFGTP